MTRRIAGFENRTDAGRQLATELSSYAKELPLVLALPRGGVPVAYEIARALKAPLDVWVVRKIGMPGSEELGLGAVAEGGFIHLNYDILERAALTKQELTDAIEQKKREVAQRVRLFRGTSVSPNLHGRTVIVVDDGIATGGTVHAALLSIRAAHPKALVLAVPVAAKGSLEELSAEVERIVCLETPERLHAIGYWYTDFQQVSDEQVLRLLVAARQAHAKSTVNA